MAISAVLLVASAITIPILALRDNNSDELDQLRADREQIIKAFTEEDECLFPNYLKAIMEREMDWDPSYCDGNRRPSDPEEPYYPTPSTDAEEDSYRKDLVAKGVTAYTEFLANNRGSAPADLPDYYCFGSDDPEDKCQLDPYFTLTGAWSYSINSNISDSNAYKPSGDHIVFFKNSRCSGTTSDDLSGLVTSGSSRQAAIVVRLTNNSYYCQEN
jgi:hypothetical protein